MYQIDERDRVVELMDIPQQDIGAPMPLVMASDGCLAIAYSGNIADEAFAVIEFDLVYAHYFGSLNDEVLPV